MDGYFRSTFLVYDFKGLRVIIIKAPDFIKCELLFIWLVYCFVYYKQKVINKFVRLNKLDR